MRENQIPREERKKILLLADDLRFPSGVGTISKEMVIGTCHRYNWVQIGAGINHPDRGKILDLNKSIADLTGVEDASVKIYPSDGYGDAQLVRQIIAQENPDALMMFTDPRYWIWLFHIEREIRQKMPIMYLNIWDNPPYPMYNKSFYKSCDGLFGISKQTVNINRVVLGEDVDNHIIRYIPHGVSSCYFPIRNKEDKELVEFQKKIFPNGKKPKFVLLYNARNIGRKKTSDIIAAWSSFCRSLPESEAKECMLYLHTDPIDNSGTDLIAVYRALCDPKRDRITFDGSRYSTEELNLLYNSCDGVILVSAAEGWGLSVTEALNTGKMFIGTVTGGIQDQMRFQNPDGSWMDFTKDFPSNHTGLIKEHGSWCIPVFPHARALVGSPLTPYIYDDRTTIEDVREAIRELYKIAPEERDRRGMEGYTWAVSSEAGFTSPQMGEKLIEAIDATIAFHKENPRSRYECIKFSGRPSTHIDYDPVDYSL